MHTATHTYTHTAPAFVRNDDSKSDQFEVVAAALSHTPQTAIESYTHPGSNKVTPRPSHAAHHAMWRHAHIPFRVFCTAKDNCTDGDLQCWSKFRAKTKKLTKNQLKKAGEKFLKTYALDLGGRDIKFVLEMSHDTKVR